MAAGKSSESTASTRTKYRIRNWREYERGLRSRGGRHDLAERGCDCRVDTTEERSPRRAASILEPRDPDRVDAAGRSSA